MAASLQLQAMAELELRRRNQGSSHTVIGLVNPDGKHTKSLSNESGQWEASESTPDVYLADKLERVIASKKRFIVIIGGRSSGKSVGIADICLIDAKDSSAKTYCLREYQSSIKNSVYSLLKSEISRLEFNGFEVQSQSIKKFDEDVFQFAGISRNIDSIKSTHGFKTYYIEESQFLSQESMDVLTPTARNKPNKGLPDAEKEKNTDYSNVSMVFVANPESSQDPFSKRFIVPFQVELDRDGYYEDDLHTIVVINYHDNPWHKESGLEAERQWSQKNMSDELYSHIWLGKYNDSVENSLITGDWFNACIDAHKKLGFQPGGAKIAAHDPSGTGSDTKGFVFRHGSVVLDIQEKVDGDVIEGSHWATGLAIQHGANYYTWDSIGIGAGLTEHVARAFKERPMKIVMFNGSESPDFPDAIYKPTTDSTITNQRTNKDVFRNLRVQYYCLLRDRIYTTYRAVVHGEYADPDNMISFDSDMPLLNNLKSELCRMPIKQNGNGYIDLYTKAEMVSKFGFKSPNLADSLVYSCRYQSITKPAVYIPKRIQGVGYSR